MDVSIEKEIADTSFCKPHVVILGAGASRAAFPAGDKNGKRLPLMADYSDIVGISKLLDSWGIDSKKNFEDIFSSLFASSDIERIKQLQTATEKYFSALEIPDKPTIYDYLVLSLREKDVIATFNWDPLLVQAYSRSREAGLPLPRLLFLHGNVAIGYCRKHKLMGLKEIVCQECNEQFTPTELLYPIHKKDYKKDQFIEGQWAALQAALKKAFMITIFGYSGPKSDEEAISLMKGAWGNVTDRRMEQTCFITIENKEVVAENWNQFIHTHHYEIQADFFDSWIANHPRRTGEAYFNQYFKALFISNNPVPHTESLLGLYDWYSQFIDAEQPE